MRALWGEEAQSDLLALEARAGDDLLLYTSTTSPSQVLSTADGDLLPESCRGLVLGPTPDYEAAVRCFVAAHTGLLRNADEISGTDPIELELVSDEAGGSQLGEEQFLRLRQRHRGIPIEGVSGAYAFLDRRLVMASGRYLSTSGFPAPQFSERALINSARSILGREVDPIGMVYNPKRSRPELVVADGTDIQHRFDAVSGEYAGARDEALRYDLTQSIIAYRYFSPTYFGPGSSPTAHAGLARCEKEFPFSSGSRLVAGSGICRYWPTPLAFYADRISQVYTTPLGGSAQLVSQTQVCGTTNVFADSPFTQLTDLRHYGVSARKNVDELADMLAHSESFFWVYPRAQMNLILDVNANTESANPGGVYSSFAQRLRLYQDPWVGGRANARDLGVIAHEYGHFVHHTYGLDGDDSVQEGWASHFALRLATHRRFVTGDWPSLLYNTSLGVSMAPHRIDRIQYEGEFIPGASPPSPNPPIDDYWLVHPNSACSTEAGKYICGRLINLTYWVLAHDECRVKFLDCSHVVGQSDIIRHAAGGYHESAWRLANSAYAYAIKNISGSGDVAEFHNLVATRYAEFRAAGYISAADEGRVLSVLASHCLGPANVCPWNTKLPGSRLPSAYTEKHPLFKEAETGVRSGTAFSWFIPFSASQHQYVAFGSNGGLKFTFDMPAVGYYRVHLATQPQHALADEVQVKDPTTLQWKTIGPMTPHSPFWTWRSGTGCNGVVRFTSTGLRDLEFSTTPSNMEQFFLDALWLEKVTTVCP